MLHDMLSGNIERCCSFINVITERSSGQANERIVSVERKRTIAVGNEEAEAEDAEESHRIITQIPNPPKKQYVFY